jgi:carbonic anhydrase
MEKILSGVARFQHDIYPKQRALFRKLACGQSPRILFITCADSRIDPNLITQAEPGELFICRNVGNIVPPHALHTGGTTAAIEYALGALKVSHIVVCGHTDCGAMKAALHPEELDEFPHVRDWLCHCDAAMRDIKDNHADTPEEMKIDLLIQQNVVAQLQHLRTHPYVVSHVNAGNVTVHGWVYDIEQGVITAYNEASRQFEPLPTSGDGEVVAADVGGQI